MASSDSEINKPQLGCPKRAELPNVNINTGVQRINTETTIVDTTILNSFKFKGSELTQFR